MLSWLIENTLVASVLAVVLLASSRWLEKRPAVGNFGWLLVIVLVVMPPMPRLFSPGVRSTITAPVAWVGGLFDNPEHKTTRRSAERSDRPYEPTLGTDWNTPATGDSYTIAADEPKRESAPVYSAPSKPVKATRSSPVDGSVLRPDESDRLANLPIELSPDRVAAIDGNDSNPPLVWPADEVARVEPISASPSEFVSRQDQPTTTPDRSASDELTLRIAGLNDERAPITEPARASEPVVPPAIKPAVKPAAKPFNTRRALATLGIAFAAAWGLGLAFVAWRQASRVRSMRSIEKASQQNEQLTARVGAIAERFGVRPPRTIVSDRVEGPMVWNLGRSVLVWPASMPVGTTGTDGMIAHELAHLRRGDHWAAWLELAAITLFWWHPLVWVAHRRAREFAELACDAWVSWVLPSDRRAYAEALVTAASKRAELESRGGRGGPALAFGVVESSRDDFKRRLTMVMTGRGSRRLPPAIAAAGLGLVMMLAPSVAGELTGKPPATVQIEGIDQIDPVFRPMLQRQAILKKAGERENAGDIEAAASLYEQAIKLGADARGDLAMMYYDAEMWDEGVAAFVAAYEGEDQDADNMYNAACCAALGGNAREAVRLLKRAVEAGYSDGDHLMRDSDLDSIHDRDDVKKIAELANSIEELEDLADEASEEEQWGEAAKAYGKLVELVPSNAEYLSMAAYSSIMGGDLDAGRAWLKKQADAGFKVETAKYNMACIESLAGNTSKALSWLEQAVEEGFDSHQLMREDDDLDAIRGTDRYAAALRAAARPERLRREMELAADFWEWQTVAAKANELIELSQSEDDWNTMQARQMLATAYEHEGNHEAAIEQLLESAKSGNNTHGTMLSIARNYAQAGQVKKGAAYLAASIETFGKNYSEFNGFKISGNSVVGINVNSSFTSRESSESDAMQKLYDHPLVKAALQRQRDREEMAQFGATSWTQLEHDARADLEEDGEDAGAYMRLGWSLLRQMKLSAAIDAFEGLGEYGSKQLSAYNIACCHAVGGDTDEAFEYLHEAVELGFDDFDQYAEDPDLSSLHDDSRWESLMADLKADHDHNHDKADADDDWDADEADWDDDDADWDNDEI